LEYNGATGALLRWYAYGLGANDVLNQTSVASGTRLAFVPDIQGSIVALMDGGASTLASFAYRPYGDATGSAPVFGYTGQRIDPELGRLYYYRARHYSPVLGRFLQVDPIGYLGGGNLYAYVGNDPLNLADPGGACPWCIVGAISSVAVGYGIAAITGQSYTLRDAVIDAALGAAGVGLASKLKTGLQLADAGTGIAKTRYLGNLGEEAIGVTGGGRGIQVGGGTRFPDFVGPNGIIEAKNAAAIRSRDATQIASYAAYSVEQSLAPVQLFTRHSTDVTRIQGLLNAGLVEQRFLPGVNNLGVYSITASEAASTGGVAGAASSMFGSSTASGSESSGGSWK
jgi:RHS repeat-associated protein